MVCVCLGTVLSALKHRHLAPPAYPLDSLEGPSWVAANRSALRGLFDCATLTLGEWRRGKPGHKLRLIDQSAREDPPDFRITAHVKPEISLKRPTKARLIQGYHNLGISYRDADRYKALHHALMGLFGLPSHADNLLFTAFPALGRTPDELAAVMDSWQGRGLFYESDGSNWDANIQPVHMRRKLAFYSDLDPELARHAAPWCGDCRGSALAGFNPDKVKVDYTVRATVKSGAQDTSTGNTYLRLELFYLACHRAGLPWAEVMAMGDDLLALVPHGTSRDSLIAAERSTGVNAKAAMFDDPACTSFLSATFAPTYSGRHAFLPLPGRLLTKLFWTHKGVTPKLRGAYCKAVAAPFLPLFQGNQFLRTWLLWHTRLPGCGVPLPADLLPYRGGVYVDDGGGGVDHSRGSGTVVWPDFWCRRYLQPLPSQASIEEVAGLDPGSSWVVHNDELLPVILNDLADPWMRVGAL
jgi:hypothetical protein